MLSNTTGLEVDIKKHSGLIVRRETLSTKQTTKGRLDYTEAAFKGEGEKCLQHHGKKAQDKSGVVISQGCCLGQ